MTDETKPPAPTGSSGTPTEPKGSADQAAPPETKPSADAPSKPAPPSGATASPKPVAPAAPRPAVKPEPWVSPLLGELQRRFPTALSDTVIFRNQPSITVAKEALIELAQFLKSDEGGAYSMLTDETAVDYPKREKRFEVIYHLYSFKRNDRLRLKLIIGEGEKVPSVVSVWPGANWLEREVYDMFGIEFEGHPDLKRILLPDEWVGHPLRKDYDLIRQDDAWVQANLHIKSGQ